MDEILNVSYEAIIRYFDTLARAGYKEYSLVSKMLILFYILEMLDTWFTDYLTERDLNIMNNAIYCLSGKTCLIKLPEFINEDSLFHKGILRETPRITQERIIRLDQEGDIRLEE